MPESSENFQELSKGKRTTNRQRHTGEGIFFTSKAVDVFRMTSFGVRWTVDNLRHDTALGLVPEGDGTSVVCQIDPQIDRSLAGIFREFSRDQAFVRTRPVVKLFEIGTTFVSRSEARRLLDGLEADFDTVEVDFAGVTDVGQGFVDELLRVWPAAHPDKIIIPTNMNSAVQFMVERGLSRVQSRDTGSADALQECRGRLRPSRILVVDWKSDALLSQQPTLVRRGERALGVCAVMPQSILLSLIVSYPRYFSPEKCLRLDTDTFDKPYPPSSEALFYCN
jgi:hypothetical protein